MERIFHAQTPAETEKIAAELADQFHGLVAFYGQMGAGKTAFIRGLMRVLAPQVRVSSPTYTVMNCYTPYLYHLDLYRITSDEDLESVGFYDIPKNACVFCEWAQHLPDTIQPDVRVYIDPEPKGAGRIIRVVT